MPPTFPGGPHERGENLLTHRPTLTHLGALAARTTGSILEIGTGTGLLTRRLAELGRPLTTIDVDPGNVRRARRRLPHVQVRCADALERSEEHTSELQSRGHLVCRLLLEKKKKKHTYIKHIGKHHINIEEGKDKI